MIFNARNAKVFKHHAFQVTFAKALRSARGNLFGSQNVLKFLAGYFTDFFLQFLNQLDCYNCLAIGIGVEILFCKKKIDSTLYVFI